jgi:hypothetical protein
MLPWKRFSGWRGCGSVANSSDGPDSLAELRAQLAEAGPTIGAGLALPRPGFATEAIQTPARVNVTCVTPLGEEVASMS